MTTNTGTNVTTASTTSACSEPTPAAGAAAADDASSRPRVPNATQVPQGAEDRSGELGDEVGRYAAPRELPGAARPSVTAAFTRAPET